MSQPKSTLAANSPRPSPAPSTTSGTNKRKANDAFPSSQAIDIHAGRNLMGHITFAVDYLKQKDRWMPWRDILSFLSPKELSDHSVSTLKQILQKHSKTEYDPTKKPPVYRYRGPHGVRSSDELLEFLQKQTTAQGIKVSEIKDGWKGALEAIEALVKEDKVIITRHKKDGAPRMIWANDPSLSIHVDNEFKDLWHRITIPTGAGELRNDLLAFGLTPTSQVKAPVVAKEKEKKKRAPRRGGKVTNTHLTGILKDYSHMRPR
ncbi:MAG: hypothetical protein M1831_005398 [Alyxoria varia]|nr:MAG: hypothetical protein M1831_005398 [Alyxoria varia]